MIGGRSDSSGEVVALACCFLNPFSLKIGNNVDLVNMILTRASEPPILLLMLIAAFNAPVNAQVVCCWS